LFLSVEKTRREKYPNNARNNRAPFSMQICSRSTTCDFSMRSFGAAKGNRNLSSLSRRCKSRRELHLCVSQNSQRGHSSFNALFNADLSNYGAERAALFCERPIFDTANLLAVRSRRFIDSRVTPFARMSTRVRGRPPTFAERDVEECENTSE